MDYYENITIRFNHGRLIASFESINDLDDWVRKSDLDEPFMYTIHGLNHGVFNFEKYKNLIKGKK